MVDRNLSGKRREACDRDRLASNHKAYIHRIRRLSYTLKRGVVVIRDNGKKANDDVDLNAVNPDGTPTVRVRLPKKWANEQFAFADLMQGANHIRVRCYDGVTRMGRIKGKIKKRVWIREGDILIVCPWSFQDEKCDIIYRYLPPQADWLRKNRYL